MAWPDTANSPPTTPAGSDQLASPDHNYSHNWALLQVQGIEDLWYNGAPFYPFTPGAFVQGATTVTYNVSWAYYRRFGKWVSVDLGITFTSAGSSGNLCLLDLPSNPFTWQFYNNIVVAGTMWFERTGISGYLGHTLLGTTAHNIYFVQGHNSAGIGQNPAYAIASGDTLRSHFMAAVA